MKYYVTVMHQVLGNMYVTSHICAINKDSPVNVEVFETIIGIDKLNDTILAWSITQ